LGYDIAGLGGALVFWVVGISRWEYA